MKILIKIKDNRLSFLNKKRLNTEYKNMLNTNVVSNDELVFSDEYITKNYKIITTFLSELIRTYSITTLCFQTMDVAMLIMPIISKLKGVNSINFESDEVLPYKICEYLNKSDIKYISAQYIPQYMFEMLDKYGIIPESRNEILFTSNFMELNGLSNYSSIYYKYSVLLDFPMSKEDEYDFATFCKINRHLKTISISNPNKLNLEEVIYFLKDYKHKNVKIMINEDHPSEEILNYLKKHSKDIKSKYKIDLKLKYSDKFIEDNLVKEANNSILRTIAILMLLLVFSSTGLIFYDNYKSMKKVTKIQKEIETLIIAEEDKEEKGPNVTIKELPKEEQKTTKQRGIVNYKYVSALKTINEDAIGWLTVNNTNIDYAILQTTDNKYYLDYNIYKQKDPNGWLFLDYLNNVTPLDDNTIIYGHNRFVNGVMFGTLNKTLYPNWYKNPENQIIKYYTEHAEYHFKIFSIYTIPITDDYIKTSYSDLDKKLEEFNKFKARSIYDFGVDLNEQSQILTLSTCQSDTTRLVVQAVLVDTKTQD